MNENNFCWVPVTERLPDKSNYDWVLIRFKFIPEGGYGVPSVAELRNGVWYTKECDDRPFEETCSVQVTDWFDMGLIKGKEATNG